MGLRIFAALGVPFFGLFLAVQYNDPDPVRWMAIYGAAMVASGLAAAKMLPKFVAPAIGLAALVWAAIWAPAALSHWPSFDDLTRWHMVNLGSEEARELIGLLIVGAWMAALGAFRRRLAPA
jgi:hypothetical protein